MVRNETAFYSMKVCFLLDFFFLREKDSFYPTNNIGVLPIRGDVLRDPHADIHDLALDCSGIGSNSVQTRKYLIRTEAGP